ncbi:MAG: nucleotidyl transferase AbiEii/AbiGii toxin family protein [bacterium]
MKDSSFDYLQIREIFHLEFLRTLSRILKAEHYALKGGVNMRFFYQSIRYSEDMDLDAGAISVEKLKESVMRLLSRTSLRENLIPFGVSDIILPNIQKAKQTETTQRFKVHLKTTAGTDLFTKIEFSRRGFEGQVITQTVPNTILRYYKLPPFVVPHYDIFAAVRQKINALASRAITQARDIFDLYLLSSQYNSDNRKQSYLDKDILAQALTNTYDISFNRFRDTVLDYLSAEDQQVYNSPDRWDEVRLKVVDFIEEFKGTHEE